MGNFKDLLVYKKAFELAMKIFEISKRFPKDEKYSLVDLIRRSARSVCANFAEAYQRRKYSSHFASRLTDVDAENCETDVWIDFVLACKYITEAESTHLTSKKEEVENYWATSLKTPANTPEYYCYENR